MSEQVDVLLINPGDRKQIYQGLGDQISAIEPPVFAGLFANYLRRLGFRVAIYDTPAMMVPAATAAQVAVEDFHATLIVLPVYGYQPSASTQNMTSAGTIARLIKEAAPHARVLMTGTHPAALPEQTMREENVDFVCGGEGPITIRDTLRALQAGAHDFSAIPDLWWRSENKIVPPRFHAPLIQDLDTEMPGVAWDLLPMERYRAHNWHCFGDIHNRSPYASLFTSLGCPFHCNFCCINAPFGKPSYRMWSPETVVREIAFLVEHHGVKNIKIVDEMFVLNKRHVRTICEKLIERGFDLNIWAYARVDTVYDELLGLLRQAGFRWLALGIESASAYVRDGAEKTLQDQEIIQTVRRIQSAGIHVMGNYMFGLPEDTHERMQATLDLALELNTEFANLYSAMAYPGSALYKMAVEKGLALPEKWHFYSQHAYETRPLANDHLSAADILAFRDKAFQTYFNHPPYLDLVRDRFGQETLDHLRSVTAIPLRRQLLEHT
ncbi:MAG: cobalamin-dependent protein [Magnetococcales bacterium]|nr:cobalamin-dependent protein [Magnetococcales bacterium]MBF0321408.1 cobalamin-dependent protein [Magnetococcales bacterium]